MRENPMGKIVVGTTKGGTRTAGGGRWVLMATKRETLRVCPFSGEGGGTGKEKNFPQKQGGRRTQRARQKKSKS